MAKCDRATDEEAASFAKQKQDILSSAKSWSIEPNTNYPAK